jgi:hypothetical protein
MGYWLPLQFWIVGAIYYLLGPVKTGTDIIVPIVINNLFFIGSLTITYTITDRIYGKASAILACILASFLAGDIFLSYSGLSEPISIFFILWAALYTTQFLKAEQEDRPVIAVKLSIITLAAALTHYIGWFLVIFISLLFIPTTICSMKTNVNKQNTFLYFLAWVLLILAPAIWLARCFFTFGDLLYPFHTNNSLIGAIEKYSLTDKAISFFQVFIQSYSVTLILILISFILIINRKEGKQFVFYIITPLAVLLGLGIWMISPLGPPYAESRFFTFWIWATLPVISYLFWSLWKRANTTYKIIALGLFLAFTANNLYQLVHFTNSFGVDVRTIAQISSRFLNSSENNKVILESDSYAEQTVIPVAGKYIWKFKRVTPLDVINHSEDIESFYNSFAANWIGISKNKGVASKALSQGLHINQVGNYFLIYPMEQSITPLR